jgi:hypothetical protein
MANFTNKILLSIIVIIIVASAYSFYEELNKSRGKLRALTDAEAAAIVNSHGGSCYDMTIKKIKDFVYFDAANGQFYHAMDPNALHLCNKG